MALQSSGKISFSDINVELGRAANATLSSSDSAFRTLAGVSSGPISVKTFLGKTNTGGSYSAIIATNVVYNESALPFSSANVPGFNDAGCWGCCGQSGTSNPFQAAAFGYPSSPNNYLSIDDFCSLAGGLASHTAWSKLAKIEAYTGAGGTGSLIQSVDKASFVGYPSNLNAGATAYYVPFAAGVINSGVAVAGSLKWYFVP